MKRVILTVFVVGFFCSSLLAKQALAKNWPQWRGPQGNGVAEEGEYPIEFSAEDHVAWKIELPGHGNSTPAVWDDHIFVTCPIDGRNSVISYNFAGKELWLKKLGSERKGKHRNGTGSNPSPVTDGNHVVAYFKSGALVCLDFAGKVQWALNLQENYGEDTLWWDLGTSPVLAAGKVVIAVMQGGDSFLVAFDLETGEEAWKEERMFKCEKESDNSYSTPCLATIEGQEVLVTWGADHLTGHDPASGKLLWECGGFNPKNEGMWRVIASPAVDNEVAIVPSGRGEFLAGINLRQAKGEITATHRLWKKSEFSTDVPSPIIHKNKVLLLSDKGGVHCLDKMSGDKLWSTQLPKGREKYYASPVLAGDTLYCARKDGVIMVGEVSETGLKVVAENDMGESIFAIPIPIRNQLLVRGEKHLFLLDK